MSEWDVVSTEAVPAVSPQRTSVANPWEVVGQESVLPNVASPEAAPPPTAASATPDPWEVDNSPERASFPQALTRGMRQTEGLFSSAIEWAGEATSSPQIAQYGREGRIGSEAAVKALPPRQNFLGIRGVGDFGQYLKELAGEQIPQLAVAAAGSLAGAGIAATAGVSLPVGATIGAAAIGLPMGIGQVQQDTKEKDKTVQGGATQLVAGAAIAALDSILPGRIGSILVKGLGKEVAENIAGATLKWAMVKEGGKQATIEGITEALQDTISEVAAAHATGQAVEWDKLPEKLIESFAGGFFMGGTIGGVTGAAAHNRGDPAPSSVVPAASTPARPGAPTDAQIATAAASGVEEPSNIVLADQAGPGNIISVENAQLEENRGKIVVTPEGHLQRIGDPLLPQTPLVRPHAVEQFLSEREAWAAKNELEPLDAPGLVRLLKQREGQMSRDLTESNKIEPDAPNATREQLRQFRAYRRELEARIDALPVSIQDIEAQTNIPISENGATPQPQGGKSPKGWEKVGGDKGIIWSDESSPLLAATKQAGEVLLQMAKRFGINKPIRIKILRGMSPGPLGLISPEGIVNNIPPHIEAQGRDAAVRWVLAQRDSGKATSYEIHIAPDKHLTAEDVYATLMHELGHMIDYEHYLKARPEVQLAIDAAYQKWRQENTVPNRKMQELFLSRDVFTRIFKHAAQVESGFLDNRTNVAALDTEKYRYWLSKAEWMAESTARYLTTNEKPLTVVDRFFNSLANSIRELHKTFKEKFPGINTESPQVLSDWLDSLITLEMLDYGAAERERDRRTQEENQKAMDANGNPSFPATPQTPETGPTRVLLRKLGLLGHRGAGVHLAAADRFNTFYKYMLSLVQVAARNPHIAPLQRFREIWQVKTLERANIMNEALETRRLWGKLPREQSDRLARFMDDYAHGRFLPEDEADAGVKRRPTPAEYRAMIDEHGITSEAFDLFMRVQADFDRMLDRVKEVDINEAMGIKNPVLQARTLALIEENFARYKQMPYMPFMRYGEFTLMVRNAANQMIAFYTFESQKKRRAGRRDIEADLLAGDTIHEGVLPEEAKPMMGLPPGLLDKMYEKLDLSPEQKDALDQLKYDFSPVSSFKHRFQRRSMTPGYSLDFQRAYLNYFFFGSNYLTNVKYAEALRNQIKEVKDSAMPLDQGTRRGQIAKFMQNHYNYTMDPKADWATFRQAATLWALGAVPAAATLNLSQMLVGSYPFLASKFGGIGFGDKRAMGAMMKAGAQLSTFYKRAKFEGMTEADMRALNEGVKEGIITEALAHELAAASEADNLKPFAYTRAREIWNFVTEKSMWMFEMTEQMNRRITFRAAWNLALQHPDQPYVQDSVTKHKLAYMRLLEKGWMPHEAAAFVVAKDATEETQYIYQQWAQPRFMRGKARTVFMFKSFMQNTLFMLWNNPGARSRSMLVMAFLGGMMGMPGGEDLRGILKALAWHLFGKDFDIEEEARRFVIEVLDGKIPPDLVLHGAARRGFGLPALMDMVGVPFPAFDRSKAVGLGNILPVDFGVLAGPHKDTSRAIAESTQKASGAAFGVGFNIFKFLTDSQLSWKDAKTWQLVMPRSLQVATKSYRYYANEEEVNKYGNRVVRFDTDDPRHLMEIIGQAMGYQPMRLAAQWDRIMAEREAITYWNIRREGLVRQLWAARNDGGQYERVLQSIRNFNGDLPEHAALKRINSTTIKQSFQSRARAQQAQESGTPRQRADVGIVRDIQRLYPEAEVDVRTVR